MIIYCISYHTLVTLSSEIFILRHLFSPHALFANTPLDNFQTRGRKPGTLTPRPQTPWAVRGEQPPRNVEAWNTFFSCVTFQRLRENTICQNKLPDGRRKCLPSKLLALILTTPHVDYPGDHYRRSRRLKDRTRPMDQRKKSSAEKDLLSRFISQV
jgi:hypothetical protein